MSPEGTVAPLSGRARRTLAEGILYALSCCGGPTRFLHDGRIEFDTKPVERAIRPVALGRNHVELGGVSRLLDLPTAARALVETIARRTLAAPGPGAQALNLLSSPLVVLGKHLKPIRDRLVGHVSGNAKQGPRRVQTFLAQHNRLRDQFLELLHGTSLQVTLPFFAAIKLAFKPISRRLPRSRFRTETCSSATRGPTLRLQHAWRAVRNGQKAGGCLLPPPHNTKL
jgi:hypothetical protein